MIRSKFCSCSVAIIIALFLSVGSANASGGFDQSKPLESSTAHHDGFDTHPSSSILDTRQQQLRGTIGSPTQQSPASSQRRALDSDTSDGAAVVFILFLFGSTNGAFTSWSMAEHESDAAASRTTILSVTAGKYQAATDTTELLRLQPGKYYDFNVTNGSSDASSIEYTIVLSEPALPVGSGQVLSGSSEVITFYLPTQDDVVANNNATSCAERGQSCAVGSDCCSERCSPELLCNPVVEETTDRDKLTEGAGGDVEDSSSSTTSPP